MREDIQDLLEELTDIETVGDVVEYLKELGVEQ